MKTIIILILSGLCSQAELIKPAFSLEWAAMSEGVRFFEGFKSSVYKCPAGVHTIGYGHTKRAKEFKQITKAKANALLQQDLKEAESHVLRIVKVPLSKGQLACLTSFTFNCGQGSLKTLVSGKGRLNAGNYQSINKILPLYCRGGGKVLNGLKKRRTFELTLWKNNLTLLAAN